MEFITTSLPFRQLCQLLGKTAVVGPLPLSKRQTEIFCRAAKMRQHLFNVDRPAGKKLLKGQSIRRCLRMQRKSGPLDIDIKLVLQLFNTPGNEITPGSDIVRKNFQGFGFRHHDLMYRFMCIRLRFWKYNKNGAVHGE